MGFTKTLRSFPRNFYTVIVMEFFERGSYYGVMSVLSVYLAMSTSEGGLGFSKEDIGLIQSVTVFLVYFFPVFSGAIVGRFGYKKMFATAFILMSLGYAITSSVTSYPFVFAALILMTIGSGLFKPLVAGTISKNTTPENNSLGFGMYYWSVNLGAFLFPLFLIPWFIGFGWNYIFVMAAIGTGWLFFLNLSAFREVRTNEKVKSLSKTFAEMITVILDYRFIILVLIYSLFWVMYYQMYTTVLYFVKDIVDMSSVNTGVNRILSVFVANPHWEFEVLHVTVVNAGMIILFQLIVSALVKNMKPLKTMIAGILISSIGMASFGLFTGGWMFLIGCAIFTIGEMIVHPKFIAYIGLIAPSDKKALYQGYAFLSIALGGFIAGLLGANLYILFVESNNDPASFWFIFAGIGLFAVSLLVFYNRLFGKKGSAV